MQGCKGVMLCKFLIVRGLVGVPAHLLQMTRAIFVV